MNDHMSYHANPFFFESPSDRRSFTDREAIIPQLSQMLHERGRRLLLHGRRRMGKTSLIQNAAAQAKQGFIFVDLSTAANLNEVAKKLLAEAPNDPERTLPRVLKLATKHLKSFVVA